MNNKSGSALQKASFALLVFIAAALGYLIVRDRIRSGERGAEAEAVAAALAAPANPSAQPTPWNPAEMKSSFAPLRPRSEATVVRVVTNRVPIVVRANFPVVASPETQSTEVSAAPPLSSEVPVAAAFTRGVAEDPARSSVSGRVTLRGTPPPEKTLTPDAMCGRLHPVPMTTRHFIVSENSGLANVFVYVKGVSQRAPQPSVPLLDNVNCEFQPYVLGVRVGQPFQLRNSDAILHNMHALPKLNREFNVGLAVAGMTLQKTFDKPEVFVQMKCDVHPWMFAYIGVVNHSFFAVTDTNGNFALSPELGAGQYTIAAVHPKAGEVTQRVTVVDGPMPSVNFTFDVPKTLARTDSP